MQKINIILQNHPQRRNYTSLTFMQKPMKSTNSCVFFSFSVYHEPIHLMQLVQITFTLSLSTVGFHLSQVLSHCFFPVQDLSRFLLLYLQWQNKYKLSIKESEATHFTFVYTLLNMVCNSAANAPKLKSVM